MTEKGNALFQCINHAPEIIVTASKGDGTMGSVGIAVKGLAKDSEYEFQTEIFKKNPYLNEIYAGHVEEAKKDLHTIEISVQSGSIYDIRKKPIYQRKFIF